MNDVHLRTAFRRWPLVLAVALLVGCGEEAVDCTPVVPAAFDSARVTIVESASPSWGRAAAWSVDPEPVLQIGSVDGEAAHQLSQPWGVAEHPDGRIALTDGQAREIRIFGPDGTHIRTFGGDGEGPGEFRSGPEVVWAAPDTLLAWDPQGMRLSWFDARGTLLRTRSLGPDLRERGLRDGSGAPGNWRLAPDGSLLLVGYTMDWDGERARSTRPTVFLSSDDDWSRPEVKLGDFPSNEYFSAVPRIVVANPFPRGSSVAWHPGASVVHVSDPECWQITRLDLEGRVEAVIRAQVPQIPVTGSLVSAVRDSLVVRAERSPGDVTPEDFLSVLEECGIPEWIAAIGELHADSEGNLWVLRRVSGYQDDEPLADVLDPEGRWLGTVRLPDGVDRVVSIGSGHMMVVWRDALEVPYLRVHRIEKPGVPGDG